MSHGHSHGGNDHGHSHGGGDHGHSHGGPSLGPQHGIFDGYEVGDESYASRITKSVYAFDPQVMKAMEANEKQNFKTRRAKAKKGANDHGHSHGGSDHGNDQLLEEQPVTERNLERYCHDGLLAHVILLHAQGVDIKRINNDQSDTQGATTLMWAALRGHLPVVKFCVDQGVDVNASTRDGQTAAHWAVTENHLEVVRFLAEHGADFSKRDARGFDPYTSAIQNDHFGMLLLLHELKPMDAAYMDNDNHTYLHWCAYRNNLTALEFCHQIVGCSVDAVDKTRRTALHWAAREGALECIPYLLGHKLSATQADADGTTPIAHAQNRNHFTAADMLRKGDTRPVSYVTSTLATLRSKRGMALFAAPFWICLGYTIAFYYLPFHIALFMVSFFSLKNVVVTRFAQRPNRALVGTVARQIAAGTPQSTLGALRGTWMTRRRDPFVFGLWMAFVCFEAYAFSEAEAQIPFFKAFFALTVIATLMFAYLTKRACYSSIVPAKSLQHSDVIAAVKDGKYYLLNSRSMDMDRHARLPLRAGYCVEVDRFLRRYDSWSLMLDCPISAANHHWFFYFIASFAICQIGTAIAGFYYLYADVCDSTNSEALPWFEKTGLLATIGYVLTNGMPCREAPIDSESFYGRHRPTKMNALAPWLWVFPLAMGYICFNLAWKHFKQASANITRSEQLYPFAMATNGKPASIMKNGWETIYGSGSAFGNFVLFLMGKYYNKVEEYEVPAPAAGTKLVSGGGGGFCSSGCGGH